jgi:membrane-associated phospholipid phosphatase
MSLYYLVVQTGLSPEQFIPIGAVLFISTFIAPVAITLYFLRIGRVSDLDVTERKERILLLLIILAVGWVGVLITLLMHPTERYSAMVLFSTVVFTIIGGMTFFEKVSLHASGITVLYIMANYLMEWRYWSFFGVIILVCWSRWYLKKHTVRQLILGVMVPVLVFLTVYVLVLE